MSSNWLQIVVNKAIETLANCFCPKTGELIGASQASNTELPSPAHHYWLGATHPLDKCCSPEMFWAQQKKKKKKGRCTGNSLPGHQLFIYFTEISINYKAEQCKIQTTCKKSVKKNYKIKPIWKINSY